ncbi:DUF4377 domain-containing protein [Acinetobacter rudis]|uniref:DUF4377 domain-containing protein n=1 Tax=Acinetobacter rudis CIP 110305 TaxID=421052 RepID=S3MWM5_9GAMM|nr:DUF4377 domain-containing protein [Acinetobacter rudis]EPF72180.1 hypothetical protein F945_02232 [Acinetobacter rudis CIP 110305]
MKKYLVLITLPLLLTACATSNESYESLNKSEQINTEFKTVYLEISPLVQECSGEGIYECLQVRKITIDNNGAYVAKNLEWENFYDGIEGYTHNNNESVILKLKQYEVENPPADASSVRYVLDRYIQRTPVKQN